MLLRIAGVGLLALLTSGCFVSRHSLYERDQRALPFAGNKQALVYGWGNPEKARRLVAPALIYRVEGDHYDYLVRIDERTATPDENDDPFVVSDRDVIEGSYSFFEVQCEGGRKDVKEYVIEKYADEIYTYNAGYLEGNTLYVSGFDGSAFAEYENKYRVARDPEASADERYFPVLIVFDRAEMDKIACDLIHQPKQAPAYALEIEISE